MLPTEEPAAFDRALRHWFRRHQRALPWRSTQRSPYAVVVSEFMLQQTQVATVIPYFERWMKRFPDWKALAEAPESEVLKAWEGLGYYRRARHLHRLAQEIDLHFQGCFPDDPTMMRALPGIGPYTAGAVASLAFNLSVPLIDGNVERVFARLFDLRGDIKSRVVQQLLWKRASDLMPSRQAGEFNEALMELGALICIPKAPRCLECPVRRWCTAPDPASLPVRTRTTTLRQELTYARITSSNESIWMLNPDYPGRWKGFHRMPEFDPAGMNVLGDWTSLTYSITRYRVQATVVMAEWKSKRADRNQPHGGWISMETLEALPLPTPMRRMLFPA
ncbi:MAG: A/G-specific adenine glycosylase [Candidatus Methylacidiphilales bacterium]